MKLRLLAMLAVLALVVVACGGDDDDSDTTGGATETSAATGTTAPTGTTGATGTTAATGTTGAAAASLAGVCPDPLVIQLDWEPESEHGGLYQMVGDGYEIDTEFKRVTGPLVASGTRRTRPAGTGSRTRCSPPAPPDAPRVC